MTTSIEFEEPLFEGSESSYHPNTSSDSEDEAENVTRRKKLKATPNQVNVIQEECAVKNIEQKRRRKVDLLSLL